MAKTSKVEDYWRQNNVENLLKELTQLLTRRMPPDPAIAIVEHLQKKYPKSFKTSTSNLPMQSITSPHSDIQNESLTDVQSEGRSSNLSQTNEKITIPTVGSAFTDLLKQQGNVAKPETMIKNLVFANRIGQQVVKMRKDIRSDKDILDEEAIKPSKTHLTAAANTSTHATPDTFEYTETNEELSVPQLIKYKQQIHMENDRRIHREQLAGLAKNQRDKEEFIRSDLSAKPEEIEQQKMHEGDDDETRLPKLTKTDTKSTHKLSVKSKEEEECLNDENVFQPQKQRDRVRQKNKLFTQRLTMPYIREADLRSVIRKNSENIICKVCGNLANAQEDPLQNTVRSLPPPPLSLTQSVETPSIGIDDWFEPIPEPQKSTSRTSDGIISPPTGSTTFRRNLFQPINDVVEHRPPPIQPLVNIDNDQAKVKRSATPRLSESGVFARSSDAKTRRPSSTRNTPSPKKLQTEPQPPLTNTQRSVHERSPNDSD